MKKHETALVAGMVRLDLYGEVQDAGRIASFMTREEALLLSRELSRFALRLPPSPEITAEDLV